MKVRWLFTALFAQVICACAPAPVAPTPSSSVPERSVEAPVTDEEKAQAYLRRSRELARVAGSRAEFHQQSLDSATSGLDLAPPRGRAKVHTVVELLVARSAASVSLHRWDDAERDLSAAASWSAHSATISLDEALVLHARARLAFANEIFHKSRELALAATSKAQDSGESGELLACESLRLAGDAHAKLEKDQPDDWVAPEHRELYLLAKKLGYPDGVDRLLFNSLSLVRASNDEAVRLMGPFPILFFDKNWRHEPTSSSDAPPRASDSAQVGDPTKIVAQMRPSFRHCYQRGLQADPKLEGRIAMTLEVGATGHVVTTRSRALGLSMPVVRCVAARAAMATFPPPEHGSANINLPIEFVKQ